MPFRFLQTFRNFVVPWYACFGSRNILHVAIVAIDFGADFFNGEQKDQGQGQEDKHFLPLIT